VKKWRKSARSGNNGGQCVETCTDAGQFLVRDSKAPTLGNLAVSRDEWAGLLVGIRDTK